MRNEPDVEEESPAAADPLPYVAVPRLSLDEPAIGRLQILGAALRANRWTLAVIALLAIVVIAGFVLLAVLG